MTIDESQSEMIDRIEYHVEHAVDYIQTATQDTESIEVSVKSQTEQNLHCCLFNIDCSHNCYSHYGPNSQSIHFSC